MRFAGTGAADQHDITLISHEGPGCKVADQARLDGRIGEVAVVKILCQLQLSDGQLVLPTSPEHSAIGAIEIGYPDGPFVDCLSFC